MKKRVAIAMSGGVDSSVAAALLLRQGYDVFGIFAKTWTPQPGDGTTCTTVADRRDALRVAAQLGIPLFTVDLEQDYRDQVVEPLFAGYAAGETPNPDVLCNRVVKFGGLWRFAQSQGAEFLATGHYARIEDSGNPKSQIPNPKLLRGIDSNKDQSYFLWDIPREVLPQVLFPIGNYQKDKVRQLAHEFALPVADKKDSQGICFLGQTNLVTFLEQRIKARPGMIRDWLTGCVLGRHQGIHNYTIGQRHGLGSLAITPESQPLYVVALEKKSATVWVGPAATLDHSQLVVYQLNWLIDLVPVDLTIFVEIRAQIRYRQPAVRVVFTGPSTLSFDKPVRAAAPGQSIVFYQGDRLLGGGVIESVDLGKQSSLDTPVSAIIEFEK
ncbi:MAG: tRNA 2-thiouridine(34) synthase MnmA [Patescibacteria group bacterium]